eukprot:COSAG03_NODE_5879_length_1156_cov_5.419111_2_plen_170_part_00
MTSTPSALSWLPRATALAHGNCRRPIRERCDHHWLRSIRPALSSLYAWSHLRRPVMCLLTVLLHCCGGGPGRGAVPGVVRCVWPWARPRERRRERPRERRPEIVLTRVLIVIVTSRSSTIYLCNHRSPSALPESAWSHLLCTLAPDFLSSFSCTPPPPRGSHCAAASPS